MRRWNVWLMVQYYWILVIMPLAKTLGCGVCVGKLWIMIQIWCFGFQMGCIAGIWCLVFVSHFCWNLWK